MSTLAMSANVYDTLSEAVSWSGVEDVAFLFTAPGNGEALRAVELYHVPPEGFDHQSDVHVSLTDEIRAHVIARATQLGGSLVEAHSHRYGPAAFSRSDLLGFEDWVPHVRWRLRRRPYLALVFAPEGFDALLWTDQENVPGPLQAILLDGQRTITPSGLTLEQLHRRGR